MLASTWTSADAPDDRRADTVAPVVIAHRGASGERPEHTLAAYELALAQTADYVELDLVATADGVLIARHENALALVALDDDDTIRRDEAGRPTVVEATTDVASRVEYADRLTVKQVDGRAVGGWFSEDFTLAEVRRLKARERIPGLRPSNQLYDDTEGIPTLDDVVGLVRGFEARGGHRAGLYLELKHPTYFASEGRRLDGSPIGIDLGALLLDALDAAGFTDPRRLYIQCFEVAPLIELKDRLNERDLGVPLIQLFGDVDNGRYRSAPRDMVVRAQRQETDVYGELAGLIDGGISTDVTYADLATERVLAYLRARYAEGIGPPRHNVLALAVGADGTATYTGTTTPFFQRARRVGLRVHPYTLRAEAPFLLLRDGRPMPVAEEARVLLEAGVDGFFIDQPDEGRLAVIRSRTLEGGDRL